MSDQIKEMSNADHLSRIQTSGSINLSMEMFEKLYLAPQKRVSGDLRKRFANPTPLPLLGFLVASFPLGCALMGWRGAGGGGAATIGTYYFFGGFLQLLGSLLEWFIGNTFPYIVFGSFGAFWLAFAFTITPFYNAEAAFTAAATTPAETAAGLASFEASFAYFPLVIAIVVFMYLVCSLRINIVFFCIFLFLDIALLLLAGAYWQAAQGNTAAFEKLEVAAGAFVFVFCMFGFYLLFAQLLQSVDFPFDLPVGDLSTRIIKSRKRPASPDVEKEAQGMD